MSELKRDDRVGLVLIGLLLYNDDPALLMVAGKNTSSPFFVLTSMQVLHIRTSDLSQWFGAKPASPKGLFHLPTQIMRICIILHILKSPSQQPTVSLYHIDQVTRTQIPDLTVFRSLRKFHRPRVPTWCRLPASHLTVSTHTTNLVFIYICT